MSSFYTSGLVTVLGILILAALVFVLPLLHQGRTYRSATLFAGLNIAILTLSIELHDWSVQGYIDWEPLTKLLLTTTPQFYITSLIVGAATIPRYVLLAPTTSRATIAGILGVFAYYFLTLFLANIIGATIYMYRNNPLTRDDLLELAIVIARRFFYFDWFFVTVTLVSALVAMVATTAIIQKTDDLPPLGN